MKLSSSASQRTPNRKSAKFRKETKYSWLIRRLLVVVPILLAGGLIYWTQTPALRDSAEPVVKDDIVAAPTVAVVIPRKDMSTAQLKELGSNLKVKQVSSLPEQMQWIKDKMELSHWLLAKTDDEEAQKEGTLYRFEALQRLSNLNRKHDLGNSTVDTELYELSSANLNHTDPEIAKIAAVTIMLTKIHEFVIEPGPGNLNAAVEKSRQIAAQLKDDDEIAAAIFEYARAMKKSQLLVADSIEFFRIVLDSFWQSSNTQAQELARRAYAEILFGDQRAEPQAASLLVGALKDRLRQQRPSAEIEIANRVNYSLHDDLLDENGMEQILRILQMLIVENELPLVNDLSAMLTGFMDKSRNPELATLMSGRLKELNMRIDQVGNVMDLSGLTAISSGRNFEPAADRARLLVVWSASDPTSVKFLSSLYGQPLKRVVQVVALSVHSSADDTKFLEKFAKEMPDFEFVTSAAESGPNRFLDRYPVPQLPYLLLLDRAGRLVSTNPDPRDLNQEIQDLTE